MQVLPTIADGGPAPAGSTQPMPAAGSERFARSLEAGHAAVQEGLDVILGGLNRFNEHMSEGERTALQMHVSKFGTLVNLAMNCSLGIGKACEKLQQS